jgi:hypothetical protein
MTEREARLLLEERKRRRVCVRMHVREDGTVQTAPTPILSISSLLQRARPLAIAAHAALALAPACVDEAELGDFQSQPDSGYEEDGEAGHEDGGDAGYDAATAANARYVPSRPPETSLQGAVAGEGLQGLDPYLIPFDVLVVLTASARRVLVHPDTPLVTATRRIAEAVSAHAPVSQADDRPPRGLSIAGEL